MHTTINSCPVCSETQFDEYLICKDYSVSQENFNIVKCKACGFLMTNPRPPADKIGEYYQATDYISHTNKSNNLINTIYKVARNFTLSQKTKLIGKLHNPGNILDYGCGTGHFLTAAKAKGWEVSGIEPDDGARAIAEEQLGSGIVNALSKLPEEKRFDIITLWHVLEHVIDLNETIDQLKSILNPGGAMIVAVPNHTAKDATIYQNDWAAYDVPRHLYHFDQDSMAKLMKKHQLKIKEVLPMKLDAYYVSLLSEKYQARTDKRGIISQYKNAVFNGIASNKNAAQNNKNYSSLTYVIQP